MTEANNNTHLITLSVEIVTPESAFYSKNVYMAVMPGIKGEFGVLPGHVSLLAGLQPGLVVTYDNNMKVLDHIFIAGGFVEVTDKSAILLVEQADFLANYKLTEVQERLSQLNEDISFCKTDSEIEIVRKNIQFTESLLATLKHQISGDNGTIH